MLISSRLVSAESPMSQNDNYLSTQTDASVISVLKHELYKPPSKAVTHQPMSFTVSVESLRNQTPTMPLPSQLNLDMRDQMGSGLNDKHQNFSSTQNLQFSLGSPRAGVQTQRSYRRANSGTNVKGLKANKQQRHGRVPSQ